MNAEWRAGRDRWGRIYMRVDPLLTRVVWYERASKRRGWGFVVSRTEVGGTGAEVAVRYGLPTRADAMAAADAVEAEP